MKVWFLKTKFQGKGEVYHVMQRCRPYQSWIDNLEGCENEIKPFVSVLKYLDYGLTSSGIETYWQCLSTNVVYVMSTRYSLEALSRAQEGMLMGLFGFKHSGGRYVTLYLMSDIEVREVK